MNVLVAVASKHGSTHEIAEAIAYELRAAGLMADVQEADAVRTLTPYDAVILGSAIYAGNWLPQAKGFASKFRTELAHLPLWLFSSGPLGQDNPEPHDDPRRLASPLGGRAVRDHQIFSGKLDKSSISLGERMIAKVVGAPDGDFRDWATIRTWGQQIAAALTTTVVSNP